MSKKRIELLAPAGGMEQLIAAVENGADAVYLGGHLFNARMNAGNFGETEMKDAVAYAHQRGVQIHVTMNTLLTSEELPEALDYAAFLYEAGVDALIVQDLGLARLIHEFMPDLPLHLSTQGTVYDLAGVETARRLGFVRVVLARELSLEEIRDICGETESEIEVFVHGALCVCYSGQCQLSRYIGGRSGNRGMCAQPCRLPYKTLDARGKSVDTIAHPLSPRDQCQIDHLPELIEAGVASLKIEGRMKSADYVGVVVSIYRKYIDQYYEKGRITVDPADRRALEQIFNRGAFTDGYMRQEDGMELMTEGLPKHQGVLCGEVIRRVKGTDLVDVRLTGELTMGDGVEIHGEKLCGNVVTYYKANKDGVRIGDIRGTVKPGDPVYRISSRKQLDQIRRTYDGKDLKTADKNGRKTEVSVRVIDEGAWIRLVFTHESGVSVSVESEVLEFSDQSLDLARMEQSLRKSGNTPFRIRSVKFMGEFFYALKVSAMNGLRREGLEKLSEELSAGRERPYCSYLPMAAEKRAQAVEYYYYDWESFRAQPAPSDVDLPTVSVIPLTDYMEHLGELDPERVIPYIPAITRGREGDWIEEHMEEIASCCTHGVYAGNLGWISRLREAGVPVLGDYGLNVYNEQSEAALDMLGVRYCVYSLESAGPENGAWPLMVLQHDPQGECLENSHGDRFRLVRRGLSDQTILISDEDVDLSLRQKAAGSTVYRIYVR